MSAYQMLNQLKAQELKQLCKEEGLAHQGTKGELIERIVQHRKACESASNPPTSEPAASQTPQRQTSRGGGPGSAPKSGGRGRGRGRGAGRSPAMTLTPPSGRGARGRGRAGRAGNYAKGANAVDSLSTIRLSCSQCGSSSDLTLGKEMCRDLVHDKFVCLECRVRMMDPFNPIHESGDILFTSQVTGSCASFSVNLSDLRQWRRDGLQVELRMVRINHSKVCHVWPRTLKFTANSKEVFRVVEPEEGHKRRDVPQIVSAGLAPGVNAVEIEMSDDQLGGFAFALVLTKPQELSQLTKEVKRAKLPEARTRVKAVLSKLKGQGGSAEEEITCLTTNKLKLICPITMDRVQEPVRGELCQHLQCFSLQAYFVSNQKMNAFNNRWVCPLCSLVLRPSDLRLDAFVENILTCTAEDVEDVDILPDGTWKSSSSSASTAASSSGLAPALAEDSSIGARCQVSSGVAVDIELSDEDSDVPLSSLGPNGAEPLSLLKQFEQLEQVHQPPVVPQPVASPARPAVSGRGVKRRRLVDSSAGEAVEPKANPLKPFAKRPAVHSAVEQAPTIILDLE